MVGGSALNTVDYVKLVFSLLSRLHVFLRCVYASSCMSMDGMVAWLRITKSLSRDFYLDLACILYSDIGFRLGRGGTPLPTRNPKPCRVGLQTPTSEYEADRLMIPIQGTAL